MEKFSVKKPFTVLVGVIMILALGIVSVTRVSTDLLPSFSFPYLVVISPYPGASPERVEKAIIDPLENALGTINGVKSVSSSSYENYGVIQMEFEEETNMDSAMVKVSSALDQMSGTLPDAAGTPTIMEVSMDMVATMYVAVSKEGEDIYGLSDFIRSTVVPYIERQNGVASVTTVGLVEKSVQVELSQNKVDALNERILEKTNEALTDAREQLDEAQQAVDDAQAELEKQETAFGPTVSGAVFGQLGNVVINAANNLRIQANDLINNLNTLNFAVADSQPQQEQSLNEAITALEQTETQLREAEQQLLAAQQEMEILEQQLQEAYQQSEAAQGAEAAAQQALQETMQQIDPETGLPNEAAVAQAQQALADAQAYLQTIQAQIAGLQEAEQTNIPRQETAQQALTDAQAAYANAQALYEAALNGQYDIEAQAQALQEARLQLENAALAFSSDANAIQDSSYASLAGSAASLAADLEMIRNALVAIENADLYGVFTDQINTAINSITAINSGIDQLPYLVSGLQSGYAGLTQAQLEAAVGFSTATTQLAAAQEQLSSARKQFDDMHDKALENANADDMLSAAMLAQLIYAQNFSMPAGYIDDKDQNAWLLRVGDEFESADDIAETLLIDTEALGAVRLSDVADITVIDNADDSYASLNGSDGVILCIYKSSAAGTNEVSRTCRTAFQELEEAYPGTNLVPMMDQGIYITWIIKDILSSILLGAALAILVLVLFLRAVKPTLVVAISIPLSVLFALVLMYFSDLSLNIMTLSGLSLGIGMLVDNSIVVMENIFRLRGRGIAAPRAAVQGARQVRGAIIASTLTTICVFLPVVFASGTVRQFLTPLALTIGYCLTASLIVALTVVPAASSSLMKHTQTRELRFFKKIQNSYGRSLYWCLRHKLVTLLVTILLLAVSVWQILRMGIVFLPEMTSSFIEIDVATPADMTREDSYARVDEVIDAVLTVEGVQDIGIMDQSSMNGLMSSFMASDGSYGGYIGYLTAPEDASPEEIYRICDDVGKVTSGLDCKVTARSSGMDDLTSFTSSGGLSLNIYGQDLDRLRDIAGEVKEIVAAQEGFTNAKDGTEQGSPTLQLHIDRDQATRYGLTTAQIYQEIAQRVETSVTSTTITVDDLEMNVTIYDPMDPLTKENLLDMTFATNNMDQTMMSGVYPEGSGASGLSAASFGSSDMFSMLQTEEENGADSDAGAEEEEKEEFPETVLLRDFATVEETTSLPSINRENMAHYLTVTAQLQPGYNITLLSRELEPKLRAYEKTLPRGYTISFGGETNQISDMLRQMSRMLVLALLFIYLVMVAQFQSLLSPFIVLFTIPLAFTGGMFGLLIARQQLTLLSLMGFLVLMGTVVNNGIVFVDYANQLRIGGMKRRDALVATGKTRMRPILMTALTTILAMTQLLFGSGMGSQLGNGMAVVITGGLAYATLMTLYIVPVIYDLFFRKPPLSVDVGDDLDEIPDDAAEFIAQLKKKKASSPKPSVKQ